MRSSLLIALEGIGVIIQKGFIKRCTSRRESISTVSIGNKGTFLSRAEYILVIFQQAVITRMRRRKLRNTNEALAVRRAPHVGLLSTRSISYPDRFLGRALGDCLDTFLRSLLQRIANLFWRSPGVLTEVQCNGSGNVCCSH